MVVDSPLNHLKVLYDSNCHLNRKTHCSCPSLSDLGALRVSFCALPVLVYEQHSEVVGEGGEDGLVRFEKDVPDGHRAVAQETELPLSVELLQQDKTMVGQLHSSTYTQRQRDETQFPVQAGAQKNATEKQKGLGVVATGRVSRHERSRTHKPPCWLRYRARAV